MALPRCGDHKRHVPYCDDCKAAVAQAEKEAQSEALQADVGFPKNEATNDEPETASEKRIAELAEQTPESEPVEEDEQAPADVAEEPETKDMAGLTVDEGTVEGPPPEGQVSDAEAAGFPDEPKPVVEIDGEGNVVPVGTGPAPMPAAIPAGGCPQCEGPCQGHPDEGEGDIPLSPESFEKIQEIIEALESGAEVNVVIGDVNETLRAEGRKEVMAWVKEYFADSIDTGAFQLLEYLEKRCRK